MVLKRFLKLAENLLHPLTMHHFGLALFLFFHLLLVRTSMQSQVTCFLLFVGENLKTASCFNMKFTCLFGKFIYIPRLSKRPKFKAPKPAKAASQPTKISSASFSSFIFSRILRFFHHRVTS